MGRIPNWECLLLFIENKDYSYRFSWMISKLAGKKQKMAPMGKKSMKNVDPDEPTSSLDHENLGCTQRECKPNEILLKEYREMLESRIFATATEKTTRVGRNLTQRRLRCPTTRKNMLRMR